MCNIELSSSLALFRPLRLFKSTITYKLHKGKLSYTRCREIFKECLKEIGDHKPHGLHSLRKGYLNFTVIRSQIPRKICIFWKTFLRVCK